MSQYIINNTNKTDILMVQTAKPMTQTVKPMAQTDNPMAKTVNPMVKTVTRSSIYIFYMIIRDCYIYHILI